MPFSWPCRQPPLCFFLHTPGKSKERPGQCCSGETADWTDGREPGLLHKNLFQWKHLEIYSRAEVTCLEGRDSLSCLGDDSEGAVLRPVHTRSYRGIAVSAGLLPGTLLSVARPSSPPLQRPGSLRRTLYLRLHWTTAERACISARPCVSAVFTFLITAFLTHRHS